MKYDFYNAIINLPPALITHQIARAAIKQGDIRLLDKLPKGHLTTEVILQLVEKNKDSGWHGFHLERIPESCRTVEVCELAVDRSVKNIHHVPKDVISRNMLAEVLSAADGNLALLPLFPDQLWDSELVNKGIASIYNSSDYKHSSRYSTHHDTISAMRMVSIFLTYVPQRIKNHDFYIGLLKGKRRSIKDFLAIVPDKYKQQSYYLTLAREELDLIPLDKLTYEVFMAAMADGSNTGVNEVLYSPERLEIVCGLMDDRMADKIIELNEDKFDKLPLKFKTSERLLMAINNSKEGSYKSFISDSESYLMTAEVCMAYVRKNLHYPELPKSVWNDEFVAWCMAHGSSFRWFRMMPRQFQTREIVAAAIDKSDENIKYARPDLVSPDDAMQVYRRNKDSGKEILKYLPQRYIDEFTMETGLPASFWGGEKSLANFKEYKKEDTYCRVGRTFIALNKSGYYGRLELIVSRRTLRSMFPEQVFSCAVGTFHKTWLEKLMFENDPIYEKPSVNKKLKELQINAYYGLEHIEQYKGYEIYANTLWGERVNYTVDIKGNVMFRKSKSELIEAIDESLKE